MNWTNYFFVAQVRRRKYGVYVLKVPQGKEWMEFSTEERHWGREF